MALNNPRDALATFSEPENITAQMRVAHYNDTGTVSNRTTSYRNEYGRGQANVWKMCGNNKKDQRVTTNPTIYGIHTQNQDRHDGNHVFL